MAKRKTTQVSGYYRDAHFTKAHRRALADSPYMLELAEGNLSARNLVSRISARNLVSRFDPAPLFLKVPDPKGELRPIYVREDLLAQLSPAQLDALIKWCAPMNNKANTDLIRAKIAAYNDMSLREDETDYVETAGEVVSIIDTVLGWFEGSSGGGSAPNGSVVGANGLVVGVKAIPAQNNAVIGFGYAPNGKQLIAFSTPAKLRMVFPNLGNIGGTNNPFPPLPATIDNGLINYALSHPDTLVRMKAGGGYEVTPAGALQGYDINGNPTTTPPPAGTSGGGSGSGSGSGGGSLLPLVGIGLLTMLNK